MGAKLQFQIAAKLDAAGFKDAAEHVRKLANETKHAKDETSAMAEAAKDLKMELLGWASVGGVIAFFKSLVDEAAQGEETMDLLGSKVESAGQNFDKHRLQVDAFTKALSEQTKFSQTEYVIAMGNAIDKVRDLGTAESIMAVSAGLAVAKHWELARATDLVAGLTMHNARAAMEVAKMFGLGKGAAKDYEGLLAILNQRYGKLAMEQSNYATESAKLSNQFLNMKEILGGGLLPLVTFGSRVFLTLFSIIIWAGKMVMDTLLGVIQSIGVLGRLAVDIIRHPIEGFKRAGAEMKHLGQDFVADSKTMAAEMVKIWGGQGALVDALKKGKGAVAPILDETAAMLLNFQNETIASRLIGDAKKLDLMKVQHLQEMALIKKHLQEIGESDKNIKKVLLEADKSFQIKLASQALELTKAKFDRTYGIALKGFESMGGVAAKFLRGDKSAWADFAKLAISTTVQTAQAMILANSAAAASQALLIPVVGEAKAASILAWGATEAAAVGALGGLAEGLIGGGGGASDIGGTPAGGGGTSGGGSGVMAAPASSGKPGMALTIVIDQMVGSTAYVDELVKKINDRVERNDVYLTSTTVKA